MIHEMVPVVLGQGWPRRQPSALHGLPPGDRSWPGDFDGGPAGEALRWRCWSKQDGERDLAESAAPQRYRRPVGTESATNQSRKAFSVERGLRGVRKWFGDSIASVRVTSGGLAPDSDWHAGNGLRPIKMERDTKNHSPSR